MILKSITLISFLPIFAIAQNNSQSFDLTVVNNSGHNLEFYKVSSPYSSSICDSSGSSINNNATIILHNNLKLPVEQYSTGLFCNFFYLLEDKRTIYSITIVNQFQVLQINKDPLLSGGSYSGNYSISNNSSDVAVTKKIEYYSIDYNQNNYTLSHKSAEIELKENTVEIIYPNHF